MFLPEKGKLDFAELLGDEKTLRKMKRTNNTKTAANSRPSVFGGGIGDIDADGDCSDEGCGAKHDRRDLQRRAAKAMANNGKVAPRRSYKQMVIGGVILLALSGGLFSTVWTIVDYLTGASLYPLVDIKTEEHKLKDIFFSGEPYVVYCQAGTSKLVPKMLIEGANMLPRGYSTVMMNCDQPLPSSGVSVYERFNLNPKDMPAFVVANGDKPKQFNRNSFYNPEYFSEFVKHQTAPKLKEVTNEIQFRKYCSQAGKCVAIGHKGKLSDSLKASIEETNTYWRKQRFASIDTSKFAIKLDDVLSQSLEKQMKHGRTGKNYLSCLCVSAPDGQPATAMVKRVTEKELYYFVKDCMSDTGMMEVKQLPSLDIKTSSGKKDKKNKAKPEEAKREEKTHEQREEEPKSNQYADDGMEVEDVDE